jgi:hypothetical protein
VSPGRRIGVANAVMLKASFAKERDPEFRLRLILRNLIVDLPRADHVGDHLPRDAGADVDGLCLNWTGWMRGYCLIIHLREHAKSARSGSRAGIKILWN